MARALRVIGWVVAGFGMAALLAIAVVFVASERILDKTYLARPEALVQPSAAALADAPHQARVLGCLSCHGARLQGNDVYDEPRMGDIIAPNLPNVIRNRTDQQIAAAIRQGIAPDGHSLFVMPSAIFSRMTDEDVSALVAWMRTLPVADPPSEAFRLSLLGRLFVVKGDMAPQAQLVALYRRERPAAVGAAFERGRHMSEINCSECHGAALRGGARPYVDFNPSFGVNLPATPDLSIVGAYDLAQFKRLMRTGVPADGRQLTGEMADAARSDFSHFSDEEITALYRYLHERAQRQ